MKDDWFRVYRLPSASSVSPRFLFRVFKFLKLGLMLREAREKKSLTQDQSGLIIDKKRSDISRIENDASNMTLKTLFDIVEHGPGVKIIIHIEL